MTTPNQQPGGFEPPPMLSQLMPASQHTRNYTRRQAEKFIEYLAHWITSSNRLPAKATIDRQANNTLVMTVVLDDPPDTVDAGTVEPPPHLTHNE